MRVEVSSGLPGGNARGMGQFESLLWEGRTRTTRRPRLEPRARLTASPLREWTARPLGRLGRPLVTEIEAYLEFFALARSETADIAR